MLLVLSGCTLVQQPTMVCPPPPSKAVPRRAVKAPPVIAPEQTDADERAAEDALIEAYGYVAQRESQAERIDTLSDHIRALKVAMAHLRLARARGHDSTAETQATRKAISELRQYLADSTDR